MSITQISEVHLSNGITTRVPSHYFATTLTAQTETELQGYDVAK